MSKADAILLTASPLGDIAPAHRPGPQDRESADVMIHPVPVPGSKQILPQLFDPRSRMASSGTVDR